MRKFVFDSVLTFVFLLAVNAVGLGQQPGRAPSSTLEELRIPAPSLSGNVLGDPTEQPGFIYLPPSYKKELSRRYPTIYLLHGYTDRPEVWIKAGYQGMSLQTEMDSLIEKGVSSEFIVVVPNGRNAYLGSFYTNSATTGNWEDYIYLDLVRFVDSRYRTIAKSRSRGVAGHSMGGYGAFMLGMKHPDIFGALYSLSPCCLGLEGDLTGDNAFWGKAAKITTRDLFARNPTSIDNFWTVAMIAVSAAFSPNREKAPMYLDLPFVEKEGLLVRNEPAYSNFRKKMPLYSVEEYRSNLMKLRGIFLDVGEFDEFTHIRRATAMLSAELAEREIPHVFEIYARGTHGNKIKERFDTKVIPFFTATLEK